MGDHITRDIKRNRHDNIIYFVYASGKTGSSTLRDSFAKCTGGKTGTMHVHSIANYQARYGYTPYTLPELIQNQMKCKEKIYLIDSYREPIERSMASFFNNIGNHIPNYRKLSIENLISLFNERACYKMESYHSYHEWFSILQIPNTMVYDHEKGYGVVVHNNCVMIKTRLRESYRWEAIFRHLVDPKFRLINSNEGDRKDTRKIYKQFKELYKVPKSYLDELRNPDNIECIEMKKMMTEKEIEDYFAYWSNRSF